MKPITERRRRSARETWDNCRFRWAAEQLGSVDNGSDPARRGSTFHRFRELYVRALVKSKQTQDHEIAAQCLAQARAELPLPWAEDRDVEAIAERFLPWYEAPQADTFYSTEGAVPGFADTLLRFDEVTIPRADTLLIRDCKTHWAIPTDATLRASWQTHFYLAAARKLFPGFTHYQMVYEHARYARLSEVIELTPAELDTVGEAIARQDQGMEAAEAQVRDGSYEDGRYGLLDWPYEAFPATGGAHCRTCMVMCPLVADNRRRAPVRVQTAHEAIAAVGEVEALLHAAQLRKDALRAYSDAHGPVESGGVRYQHWPGERVSYGLREFLDALVAEGVAVSELPKLALSSSTLKAITTTKGKWRKLADALKAIAQVRPFTQFEGKRVAADDPEDAPEQDGPR